MALPILAYIIIFTTIGSVCGLVGGILLLYWRRAAVERVMLYIVSFAIGSLLGAAFLDLIPESVQLVGAASALLWTFTGLMTFFVLDNFVRWHFCHELVCRHKGHKHAQRKSFGYLLTIGDTFHNFIDGVIIAAAFLIDIPLGIVTSLAVFFHEIPQEVADFGVMLYAKMPRKKILLYNLLSALASFIGALIIYFISPDLNGMITGLAAFAAGGFLYIALADLAPETHSENLIMRLPETLLKLIFVFVGIGLIWLLGAVLGV